jgi:predicted transposase/invertase (TIGR01784 family)
VRVGAGGAVARRDSDVLSRPDLFRPSCKATDLPATEIAKLKQPLITAMNRFATPYTDTTFKFYFGRENTKGFLRDFLNTLLPAENQIEDLVLANTEQLPTFAGNKGITFDLLCTNAKGETFIVEMQRARQRAFIDRSLYYTSTMIRSQLDRGTNNFDIKPVFFIAVMNFTLDDPELRREAVQEVTLKSQNAVTISKKLRLFYVQLPLFKKEEGELSDRRDKWLYSLKHLEELDRIPPVLESDPVFQKFYDTAAYAGGSKEVRDAIEREWNTLRNSNDYVGAREDEAREKGLAEGLEKGRAESAEKIAAAAAEAAAERAKAAAAQAAAAAAQAAVDAERAKAVATAKEANRASARALKTAGVSTEIIAKVTNLDPSEIAKL